MPGCPETFVLNKSESLPDNLSLLESMQSKWEDVLVCKTLLLFTVLGWSCQCFREQMTVSRDAHSMKYPDVKCDQNKM